jgi:hypothetical protein
MNVLAANLQNLRRRYFAAGDVLAQGCGGYAQLLCCLTGAEEIRRFINSVNEILLTCQCFLF